ATFVFTDAHQELHVTVSRKQLTNAGSIQLLLRRRDEVHQAAAAAPYVNSGKMVALGKIIRQHDMPIQYRANLFGDRVEADVPLHQNSVDSSDGAVLAGSGTLEQSWQRSKQRGRKSTARRWLAGRKADFALGTGEPGEAVHQQQHMTTTVAEIFSDRRRHLGGLDPFHGWTVGSRGHNDGAIATLRSQLVVDEFTHLAPAFTN